MNKLELAKRIEERLTITLTKTYETKKGSKWNVSEKETRVISLEAYNNILDFKLSSDRYYKGYTCVGNIVDKIISLSPSKDSRSVYKFDFKLN